MGAHRAMWFARYGDPGAKFVLHKCDFRPCCNPDHLFLGTHQDNMADMMAKGRRGNDAAGSKNGQAKLTECAVADLRRAAAAGATLEQLAEQFNVSPMNVRSILARRTWRHVA